MYRFGNLTVALLTLLLVLTATTADARGQAEVGISERTELVYFIGQVNSAAGRKAQINLGEAHSLEVIDAADGQIQTVAIFRADGSIFRPIGIATVIEARATVAQVTTDYQTHLQRGDVVLFVRQMSELRNGRSHEDHVLRSDALRKKRVATRSSLERNAMAQRLAAYKVAYPKWERSRSRVAGKFYARQDLQMTPDLERLLKQINLFRRYHADGFRSIKAAGPKWATAMNPLLGTDAKVKHRSATAAAKDSDDGEQPLDVVKLRRITDEQFFDAPDEQKNAVAFLVATALREQPRSPEQWVKTLVLQTQFPEWVDNDRVVARFRDSLQALESPL